VIEYNTNKSLSNRERAFLYMIAHTSLVFHPFHNTFTLTLVHCVGGMH